MVIYERYTIFLHFINAEYYKKGDSGTEGLGMALNEIVVLLYMIDILYYTIIVGSWGFGMVN